MFSNFIKTTFRGFLRRRGVSIFNVLGLSIGLACFILAFLFVQYKLSYDDFHEKSDRIVRVLEDVKMGSNNLLIALNSPCLGKELKEKYPEIELATTIRYGWDATLSYKDKKFYEKGFIHADEDFFEIFSFPIKYSAREDLLSDPYSILISETLAKKYFGEENPIGKIVSLNDTISLNVTAVFEDFPQNSHLKGDIITPLSFLSAELKENLTDFGSYGYLIYLYLSENSDYKSLETKITNFFIERFPDEEAFATLHLQPMEEAYLYSGHIAYDATQDTSGGITVLYIVIITSLAILILACINFMNLITAQSDSRAKEIGVRKVFGSSSAKLIIQLLGENIFQVLIAFFFAMVIAEIAHPVFNQIMNVDLKIPYQNWRLMGTLFAFAIIIGILSGLYPSIFLSGANPMKALQLEKNNKIRGGGIKKSISRFSIFYCFSFTRFSDLCFKTA